MVTEADVLDSVKIEVGWGVAAILEDLEIILFVVANSIGFVARNSDFVTWVTNLTVFVVSITPKRIKNNPSVIFAVNVYLIL